MYRLDGRFMILAPGAVNLLEVFFAKTVDAVRFL